LAGRYTVLRRLGSGGAATVFLAEDDRLGREVAIKRLHTDAPAASLKRFRREARLGAALNHPNFVAVHDTVVSEDGDALIVMEYVPGLALAELAATGPMRSERALPILRAVAEALDHAHAEGVVHRDVKPANVLVREDGVVKLADLGIAKAVDATQITSEGSVIGTLPYMAPERLRGPGAGGPESDVYSLAAVAYELLSGHPPRDTTSEEAVQRVPDLRAGWPDAPAGGIAVLERALDPDPARRQPSAGRLVAELEAVLGARPVEATEPFPAAGADADVHAAHAGRRPFEPPPAARRPARRRATAAGARRHGRGRIALALLAAALVAIGAIGLATRGGDDEGGGGSSEGGADASAAARPEPEQAAEPAQQEQAPADSADESASESAEPQPVAESPEGAADGSSLNDLGYALIEQGRYDEAIPLLERAVSVLEGSASLTYAYALFNLGHALRLAGRPDEAIPILEARLEIPNQRGTVRRELEAAMAAAGEDGD
jgi:tetratricopeptide (TPR) repeat protein